MGHGQSDISQTIEVQKINSGAKYPVNGDIVLEKSIFNNIFEKDIRRVFVYKKAERLAKAIQLIAPAFAGSASLMERIDAIAMRLIDAALLSPTASRTALSRELLALSSILSIARTGGLLSGMNADLMTREAHNLLQEVALYEEPRLALEEMPSLSTIAKKAFAHEASRAPAAAPHYEPIRTLARRKGHVKDTQQTAATPGVKDRQDAILSVIKNKQRANIKDISTLIRGVSEKTIQRELMALIAAGTVVKQGERRWSTYSLA